MTASPRQVSPREGLDVGAVHDLVVDCREVDLARTPPREQTFAHRDLAVPERLAASYADYDLHGG